MDLPHRLRLGRTPSARRRARGEPQCSWGVGVSTTAQGGGAGAAPSAIDTERVPPTFRHAGMTPARPSPPRRARLRAAGPPVSASSSQQARGACPGTAPPAARGNGACDENSLQPPPPALLPRHSRLEPAVLFERITGCTHEPGRTNSSGCHRLCVPEPCGAGVADPRPVTQSFGLIPHMADQTPLLLDWEPTGLGLGATPGVLLQAHHSPSNSVSFFGK